MSQAEHDARHPGLICQTCPRTIAAQQRIREKADRLRLPWWRRLTRGTT